jgi:DNA-binding NarL/FixJ family response regulator
MACPLARVATHLAYSERTIKNVIQELTLRLNARNRTQAVAHAVRTDGSYGLLTV